MAKVKIPKYTLAEELISAISHGIGAAFSIVALILCIIKSRSANAMVSTILYTSFMILLYTVSCVYHALSPRIKGKKVMRVLDHCFVLLMVAGTYIPISLSLFWNTALGYTMFGIVSLITIVAIVFNAIDVDKFQVVSLISNLVLGWGVLVVINRIYDICGDGGVFALVFGGILYSVGAILYALGSKIKYMHSIFHFFVLGGSIFHFIFIYSYCI